MKPKSVKQSETRQHTSTPWHIAEVSSKDVQIEADGNGDHCIAQTYGIDMEANAAFIVRAVNAHEALLEFAKLVSHSCLLAPEWKREADKAIVKAEGLI